MRNNNMLIMVSRIEKFLELRLTALVLLIALAAALNVAFAKINVGSDGLAVHGYDVVAYFLEGRAAQGTTEHEHSWQGANWRFSSKANKNLFIAEPERYAPQYGGFCAVCLALDGELTDANPKAWTIVDGKLYLNYSMQQRTQWRIKSSIYVKYGDDEWIKVTAQLEGLKSEQERTGQHVDKIVPEKVAIEFFWEDPIGNNESYSETIGLRDGKFDTSLSKGNSRVLIRGEFGKGGFSMSGSIYTGIFHSSGRTPFRFNGRLTDGQFSTNFNTGYQGNWTGPELDVRLTLKVVE